MEVPGGSGAADALWLETLQRICGLAAHELRGVLNGVSVNLEVVRSRAEKPDTSASAVSSFANAASDQMDTLITMTEALIGLARSAREPVELAPVVHRMGALLAPTAKADGRSLHFEGSFEELGATSANGSAVRFVLGSSLLAATTASSRVRCAPLAGNDERVIRIESCDGAAIPPQPDLIAAAADSGIRIRAESSAISISFPR